MADRMRVRINLSTREVEIEGDGELLRTFAADIAELMRLVREAGGAPQPAPAAATSPAAEGTLGSFGEYMQRLPNSATEVDRMLAAGFWVQENSPDRLFTTGEANRRLVDLGFKIGNPSQCVRQSIDAKRVFRVHKGHYRVTPLGRDHLRRLMGDVIPATPQGA